MKLLAAALLISSVQGQTDTPAVDSGAAKTQRSGLHCAARTPAGDLLLFEATGLSIGKDPPVLIVSHLKGSPWPEPSGAYLALSRGQAGNETEWELGPRFIRLGTNPGIRNVTIFSGRRGKIAQAIAFGFCGPDAIAEQGAVSAGADDVFDEARWQNGCFFVGPGSTPRTGRFKMNHSVVERALRVTFEPVEGALWPEPVSSKRELLSPAPPSGAKGITLGVARFRPDENGSGPRGMEVAFIDEAARRVATVLRFENFGDTGRPGFAICAMTSFQDRTQ